MQALRQILILAVKELALLGRDAHGLLLLFVMPCLFILIMTFTLSEQFGDGQSAVNYFLIDQDQNASSLKLVAELNKHPKFNREVPAEAPSQPRTSSTSVKTASNNKQAYLVELTARDKAQFLVVVKANHRQLLLDGEAAIELSIAPSASATTVELFTTFIRGQLINSYIEELMGDGANGNEDEAAESEPILDLEKAIASHSLYSGGKLDVPQTPTAVQQNVPAWLLFAMFFITIPMSTTMIREREQGTALRLRSMGIANYQLLLGKLLPFFAVNLLQIVAMLMVGIYLIPALGGERLAILGTIPALILVSSATSLLAVSYALLIAHIAQTTEQATITAGVCNIIMAAIGGIMVPRFLMPSFMQDLSNLSPMAWGLDGYLDLLLREGDVGAVLPEVGSLLTLAVFLLLITSFFSKQEITR